MELKIDKVTFEEPAFQEMDERIAELVEKKQDELIALLEKKYQFPKYMNKM
ncbi:TPA: hypothetical protein KTX72_002964, partial [Enterococcus faecium]|nr:hypothetical protein [Enterococcus faecium]